MIYYLFLSTGQGQYGSMLDFWNFVRGLRWLNPVMSPSIEHLNRMRGTDRDLTVGQMWVRQSLLSLNLSVQLQILVTNKAHRQQHYEGM